MLSQLKKFYLSHIHVFVGSCLLLIGMLFSDAVLAAPAAGAGTTITNIATHIGGAIGSLTKILQDVSTITGVGFIIAAFFKLHAHRNQPTQVPMSQGISLLLIGAGLCVFPHLLNVVTTGVFGLSAVKIGHGISAISATGG